MHRSDSALGTLVFAAFLLVIAPVAAQDKTAAIDKIFSWVKPGMPGCVAAASKDGTLVVNRAWGLADLERNVPLTTDSIIDAASIRKQFIAAAILLLVEEKKLALTDDVHKYVPELPDYGHAITIDHMLTHTSGLRDWIPLRNFNRGSELAIPMILRQRTLSFTPGEEWSYSNSGYVLLTEIVARVSKTPFADFARARLFEPAGMTATSWVEDLRQVIKNRALAYEPSGAGWRADMLLDNERGGGGALLTTASDLVRWNDALTSGRPSRFVVDKLQEPATLKNGRKLDYARGLTITSMYAGHVIHHGGGAAGYRSILARFPESGMSIAVMCNAGEASDDRDDFAGYIFDLFVAPGGVRPPSPPLPADAAIDPADLKSKTGLFFNERSGDPLRLGVANNRLVVAGAGPLIAMTKDRFRIGRPTTAFMSMDAFEVTFVSPDQFDYASMEGQTSRYRRAQAWTPAADDLKALSGRYDSDELRATFEVTPGKSGVMVRLNDAAGAGNPFQAVDRDTFMSGPVMIRFRRDQAGAITGLELSTPALRRVTFTRVR